MYIFIDESGDLEPGKGTPYFVIGMICYYGKTPEAINTVMKKHNRYLWEQGWPREVEIKATNLYNYDRPKYDIDRSKLRINARAYLPQIYSDINKLDIKVGFLIHKPANQTANFRCLHKEMIYNYLSKKIYLGCFGFLRDTMDIYVDQRNITLVKKQKSVKLTEQRLNLDYIGYIRHELTFQFASRRSIQPLIDISFENSRRVKGLQVADYMAWAIRKKYEGNSSWCDLLTRIERIEIKDNFP